MARTQGRKEFPGRADQVGAARRFVATAVEGWSPAYEVARLLVSEAVTNALLHSQSGRGDGGGFAVAWQRSTSRLRVEVEDRGGGQTPHRRAHHLDSVGGRGLELLDALATRWGVSGGPSGRTVWFELDLTSTASTQAGGAA